MKDKVSIIYTYINEIGFGFRSIESKRWYNIADNSEMDYDDQLNQSILLEAKATGQEYSGRMTARAQKFAAVGSLLGDANRMGYIFN